MTLRILNSQKSDFNTKMLNFNMGLLSVSPIEGNFLRSDYHFRERGVSINCIYYPIFSKVLCLSFCEIPSPYQDIHMQIICVNRTDSGNIGFTDSRFFFHHSYPIPIPIPIFNDVIMLSVDQIMVTSLILI